MEFNNLKIRKVTFETNDTITLHLSIPDNLKEAYAYQPGQYVTVECEIRGEVIRRSYSMSSAPYQDTLAITIKRVPGGKMSTFAHSNWKADTMIKVSTPEGKFALKTNDEIGRDHYFIAAGSGITPVISMIKSVLESEPLSSCYLLYGSRSSDNIIFYEELNELEERYKGQLHIIHTLSRVKKKGLLGMFKKKNKWTGQTGRIDEKKIKNLLEDHPGMTPDRHFYICGPGNMIDLAQRTLSDLGIADGNIKYEHFAASTPEGDKTEIDSTTSHVKVILNGDTFEFETDGEVFLLDEMVKMKKNPPYSCTSGACSSCMAKVTEGHADMEVCYALDQSEIDDGYILTCQAKSTTPTITVDFDQ